MQHEQDKNRLGTFAGIYFLAHAIVFFTTLFGFQAPQYVYLWFSPASLGDYLNEQLHLSR